MKVTNVGTTWSKKTLQEVRSITVGFAKQWEAVWWGCTSDKQREAVEKEANSLLNAQIRARLLADRPDVGGPSMSVDDGWRS